jgi:hypothetical protein
VVERVVDDVLDGRVVLLLGLDHLRPVAAAEEVVLASMALVEGTGVGPVQVPHSLVEVRGGRLDEEVVVVAHEAAHVHPPSVAALDPPEDVEEDNPILGVAHDRRVVVPAAPDVVARAGSEVAVRPSDPSKLPPPQAVLPPRLGLRAGPVRPRHVPGTRPGKRAQARRGHVLSGLGGDFGALEVLMRRAVVPLGQGGALARLALAGGRATPRDSSVEGA